jgi:adenylate cyclase class 2
LLRLRRAAGRAIVTYKGPRRIEDGVRAREELEFEVSDAGACARVLEALGYRPSYRYEKYREVYRHERVEIVIDELPIGCFLEIEGDSDAIHAAAAALGFGRGDYLTDSYADLHHAAGGSGDMLFGGRP